MNGPAPHLDARSHWSGQADTPELERWRAVAEGVAQQLEPDVLARDRANEPPHREVQLLKDSGLITLLDPVEAGGGGGHWASALLAVRILARTDASIAQLLAYHYINEASIAWVGDPAERLAWLRRTVSGRWLWGDSVNPVDPDLELHDEGQGRYRLTGTKRFSTGSAVGDALLVTAAVRGGPRDGQLAFLVLLKGHPGVEVVNDWDHLGQRLSASNSVKYHDAPVQEGDILGWLTDDAFASLTTPGIQLAFGNLYLGIAEGALKRGREITTARKNAWFLSQAAQYREDPFIQRTYGELVARVAALAALAGHVNRRFDEVVAQGHSVTAAIRGDLAIEVAQLKVVATETALEVAHRIYETTGSSSTASAVGLDLYWRNIRTHSLHDPVDYKKLEVGAHYLNGSLQPVSLYT